MLALHGAAGPVDGRSLSRPPLLLQAINSGRLNHSGRQLMNIKMFAVATALIGAGLGMTQPAQAVTQSVFAYTNPGGACQLSIPTTNTGVRPKATGFRNEGTVNNFVICGYTKISNSSTFFKSIV